ncbi:anthranilate synthase family protein [Geodermatophilus sp. DSM 44513]|uniref:anthranilate synthase family protein n=1 Tax=Geodermatophilus sp. DSM 44513 TaxID=1528104 RepID=UPI001412FC06|nr:chorismate-binding protein [Geodermatophilus sp. DSM 44513]WNV75188.1 anthranilate synthase family protein [Geodermatophilus sp. DSM 44513]
MAMKANRNDSFALIMKSGVVHYYAGESALFDDLEQAQAESDELILAVPFRQALWGDRPMSGPERSARRHVSAIRVRDHEESTVDEFLQAGEATPTRLVDGHFDVDDDEYAQRVRAVVHNEIRAGHGSNFVLHRTYRGRITSRDAETEMSIYRSLLRVEAGSYWTFLIHFPDHSLIGASPEMHLRRSTDGLTTMNPISGTYRYPNGGPDERSLRDFLQNPKERNELYMVADEELKIMSDLCDERPWISEPNLRFMSNLAHTEYFIHGYSSLPWTAALHRSLVAPTVLGSPLESAFRMAQRNDLSPRNYLGGVLAHVAEGTDLSFDSAILIRTALVETTGEVSIPVGSTIVRDSDPALEAAETIAKASGVLAAFSRRNDDALRSMANELLEQRANDVAEFWMMQTDHHALDGVIPKELNALVVDHEDRFTGMLAAHLKSLGLNVSVITESPTLEQLANVHLLVLGPGPGDPNDESDPRIASARELARWVVETRKIPTLAVCLSHQLICRELGLDVRRLPRPNQGSQRNISLFGDAVRVGFYNSFSAYIDGASNPGLDVAYDDATMEVYAVKTDGIVGLQFHPESILSVDGA